MTAKRKGTRVTGRRGLKPLFVYLPVEAWEIVGRIVKARGIATYGIEPRMADVWREAMMRGLHEMDQDRIEPREELKQKDELRGLGGADLCNGMFYGNEQETYYVSATGKLWCVQSPDLRSHALLVDALPAGCVVLHAMRCRDLDVSGCE